MTNQPSDAGHVRRRVTYRGRVQGVGFRYTTESIARRFPVAGYVKNLPGGEVELVVEGEAGTLRQFLDEVAAAFAGNISDARVEEDSSPQVYRQFEIRYD